jgi:hypothetical protein
MDILNSVRLSSPRNRSPHSRSSPKSSHRDLSSVVLDFDPLGRISSPRPKGSSIVPIPIQAWGEIPKTASSSPKKPAKISLVKPLIPVLTQPTKTTLRFSNKNQIHPTGTVATVGIVHNEKIGLPSKLLAIYYVDLIYDTIKRLAIEILGIVVDIGKIAYIYPPIFNGNAVSKLEKLIDDIDKNRYIYKTSSNKSTQTKDINVLYLFIKYLIKKPRGKDSFLAHMTGIKRAQGYSAYDIKDYYNEKNRFDGIYFQRVIDHQNSGLSSKVIKSLSNINHHDVENKLQSINNTMVVFIDIINNILNDYVETRVTSFSGGGYVFFANYRYNKDEKEYTPLIYNYIDAYNTNFQNIYDYFQNIFKYFKKINKKMGNIYEKEYKNVVVEYKKHPEYKKQSANARIATQAINATIATNAAVSAVKKQLNNISNNVATKDFENRLKEMKHRIGVTKDEIDNLYHKI